MELGRSTYMGGSVSADVCGLFNKHHTMIKRLLVAILGFYILLIFLPTTDLYAKTVEGTGYHYFGPDITENSSCLFAKLKAEEDAIIKGSGETVSAQDWKVCNDPECVLTEYRWTMLNGMILRSTLLEKTITEFFGQQVCKVTILAEVMPVEKDPSFTATIHLNTNLYNVGDKLIINVDPSQKMYVYVFSWNSADFETVNVHRIFPNKYETAQIKKQTIIPSSDYELVMTLPNNYTDSKPIDEYLFVVMSKKKMSFAQGYKFPSFNQLLLELDPYETNVEIVGITIAK